MEQTYRISVPCVQLLSSEDGVSVLKFRARQLTLYGLLVTAPWLKQLNTGNFCGIFFWGIVDKQAAWGCSAINQLWVYDLSVKESHFLYSSLPPLIHSRELFHSLTTECKNLVNYSAPDRSAEYCDERVCLCVCVCLSAIISSKLHVRSSPNFCACCLWPWLGPPLAA